MRALFSKLWNDKRGNALVIAGAALPLVIGSAGLATDTIQWVNWKRHLQRAADSAAIAGVYAKMQNQDQTSAAGKDLTNNNHTGVTLLGGYPRYGYPADTADYKNAFKVTLAIQQNLAFSSMFTSSPPIIVANATAAVISTGDYCVVSLEDTATTGLTFAGDANVDLGCGMITNSTSLSAAVAKGSSDVKASPVAAVGGIQSSNNWDPDTQLLPFTVKQEDPFAKISPSAPSSTCNNDPNVGPQDVLTDSTGTTATVADDALAPGCYKGLTIKGTVKLKPGTYYVDGGDVDFGSQASVEGDGVTIVMSNSSGGTSAKIGTFNANGGATVKLSAPSSGDYKGLIVYQDRRASDNASGSASSPNTINGNSSSFFQGAFYFPKQQVTFSGNSGMSTACMQMVSRRVYFTGNSSISNTCPAGSGAQSFKGQHVRLVD